MAPFCFVWGGPCPVSRNDGYNVDPCGIVDSVVEALYLQVLRGCSLAVTSEVMERKYQQSRIRVRKTGFV